MKYSGDEQLQNLDPSLRRVFCEDHFDKNYMRCQFNRTTLRKDAISYSYVDETHEIGDYHLSCFDLIHMISIRIIFFPFICRLIEFVYNFRVHWNSGK